MSRIFISYARTDEKFARQLATALSDTGAEVWLDVKDIPAGMNWSRMIQDGLDTCEVMLLIITPESMASENVETEWQYYFDEKKPIIPILSKPAKIHFQLRRRQQIDFHTQDFDKAFVQLQQELERNGFSFIASPRKQIPPNRPSVMQYRSQEHILVPKTDFTPPDITGILPAPFDWCYIPAGEVTLDYGNWESDGYKVERKQTFPVERFFMAKYPITNAQYQIFVDAKDGYSDSSWWDFSRDAQKWQRDNPKPGEGYFKGDNLPREQVTWYDSVAFCRWLSKKTKAKITLPTEQQWQRSAQGDDGWEYPWGDEFDKSLCNTIESGIGQTTPVTQYQKGASSFGVMDMSGNVWEWTISHWDNDMLDITRDYRRVLRGGSWNSYQHFARSASRRGGSPFNWNLIRGFRVVCAFPI